MRSTFRLIWLMAILFFMFGEPSLRAESMTITFPTLGNCYLCQVRIEGAVNTLTGVESVFWDYNTDITTVTYDDMQLDAFTIMNSIANVGHDTEWFPAPDSAYNLLIGTCCEYERTMDYSGVQVGYLSLMGIWVYHLGVAEGRKSIKFNVFPSAGNGLYTYYLENQSPLHEYTFTVINLGGKEVFRDKASQNQHKQIDLRHLTKGQYLLIVSGSREILACKKLIKL